MSKSNREIYGGPEYERRLQVYMRAYEMQRPRSSSLDRQKRSGQRKFSGNTLNYDKGSHRSGVSITYKDPDTTLEVTGNDVMYVSRIVVHDNKSEVTSRIIFAEPHQPQCKALRSRSSRSQTSTIPCRVRSTSPQDSGFEETDSNSTLEESSESNLDISKSSLDSFASSSGSEADEHLVKTPLCKISKISKRKNNPKHSRVSFCEQVRVANFFSDDQSDESASEDDSIDGNAPTPTKEWRESFVEHNELLKTDSFCITWQRSPLPDFEIPSTDDHSDSTDEGDQPDDNTPSIEEEQNQAEEPNQNAQQHIPSGARQRVVLTAPFTLIFNISQAHKTGSPRISARLTPIHTHSKDEPQKHIKRNQKASLTSSMTQQLFRWPSTESKEQLGKSALQKQPRRASIQCVHSSNQFKQHTQARRWSTQTADNHGYQPW